MKAHANHEGNERADDLAKEGMELDEIRTTVPTSMRTIRSGLVAKWLGDWQRDWISYGKARQTRIFFPERLPKCSREILRLSQGQLSMVMGCLTGHNDFAYHRSLCNEWEDDGCTFCNTDRETFYHILVECPYFHERREQVFGRFRLENVSGWTVKGLLKFVAHHQILEILCGYRNMDDSGDIFVGSSGSDEE